MGDPAKELIEFMEEITLEVIQRGGIHEITNEDLDAMFKEIGAKYNEQQPADS